MWIQKKISRSKRAFGRVDLTRINEFIYVILRRNRKKKNPQTQNQLIIDSTLNQSLK